MLKQKPYFDPYIYQKVLEDVWLPPLAKEILKPWSVSHRHKFLFPEIKGRFKVHLEEEQRFIESIADEETATRLSELHDYIGSGEEEKQQWFVQLRKDFNLAPDYKFE